MTEDELKISERLARLDESHRNLMARVYELEFPNNDKFCKCCGKKNGQSP